MYNFNDRLKELLAFDIIRICKIFEIFQYSLLFLILLSIFVYLLNKYYYKDIKKAEKYEEREEKEKKNTHILIEFKDCFIDSFLIIMVFYYVRKIALLFPSIPNLIYPKFNPLTTLDYSIHIALVVVFIELLPSYKERIHSLYLALKNEVF